MTESNKIYHYTIRIYTNQFTKPGVKTPKNTVIMNTVTTERSLRSSPVPLLRVLSCSSQFSVFP